MKRSSIAAIAALLLSGLQSQAATLTGTVVFEGKPPVPPVIDTRGKDKHCMEMHRDDPLRADGAAIGPNGEFQWIFVWVDNPPKQDYLPPETPAMLTQKNCRYEQPVLGLMAGQPLEIHNNDETDRRAHV